MSNKKKDQIVDNLRRAGKVLGDKEVPTEERMYPKIKDVGYIPEPVQNDKPFDPRPVAFELHHVHSINGQPIAPGIYKLGTRISGVEGGFKIDVAFMKDMMSRDAKEDSAQKKITTSRNSHLVEDQHGNVLEERTF